MCVCVCVSGIFYAFLAARLTCCRSLPPSPSTMFPLSSDTDLILSPEACGSAKEVVVRSLDWSCSTYFKNSCRLVLRRRLAISINSSWCCWLALIDALFVLLLLMFMMLMLIMILMIRLFNACVSKDFFFLVSFADTHTRSMMRENREQEQPSQERDGRGRNLVSKVSR